MTLNKSVHVGSLTIANNLPFTLIAGPCQIESLEHALKTAQQLKDVCEKYNIGLIYKSSFDKANRTSIQTQRGLGMEQGLDILNEVKVKLGLPILTDIHSPEQCAPVALIADILQIPAFLCRQTDLLIAAARTNKVINVKKGQFLAPWDMRNVADKIASAGNEQILLCDRGTSFGYNTLVSDMRGLPIMAQTGYPVVFDATHSVQQPGGMGNSSGGQREFVSYLAKAAMAVGIAALFIETHEDPDNAPSDGPNMIKLDDLPALLHKLTQIDRITKEL
ncbi:2-dehydro-3-deoxyphosphooctonate aldolase [Commensalibacter intestini A911]|uniref:2-dehydro-3-deoxyphosphooctonate aldolase n=2 Tax=Commensalibacter intestini TaxID=479936 RepID=A0A251ZXN8_9PROT|nr:3-deoxy-8-phosphooctulonate synthase [Commensalibacter intestini]EHD14892.1 2-dehydro-3-deoxyphosphooctonate aldolase [Commensalibacter intestini A911]OUI79424.1 2-dehydro-3-deoxyphosphooctonate aldolase [Commensalibacter intestini]